MSFYYDILVLRVYQICLDIDESRNSLYTFPVIISFSQTTLLYKHLY